MIQRSILFHHTRHPNEVASADIEACLTHLTVAQQVRTQNQHSASYVSWRRSTRHSTSPSSVPKPHARPQ